MDEDSVSRRGGNQPPADWDFRLCWPPKWGLVRPGTEGGALFLPTSFLGSLEHIYDTLEAAERFCAGRGMDLAPAPLPWRRRERLRFDHSEHERPVWHRAPWWHGCASRHRDHFVHVSRKDRSMLAFTVDDRKGACDIQTMIKPGRYLAKYFDGVLTEKQIQFNAQWQASGVMPSPYTDPKEYELRFAETREDIVRVYTEGPHSCMSHSVEVFRRYNSGSLHPTAVYAAGDLAVAYLQRIGDWRGRDIAARCLVWPAKHQAGRVYPAEGNWETDRFESVHDSQAASRGLFERLKAAGYSFPGEGGSGLTGAKLLRLPAAGSRNLFLMPYLDNSYQFRAVKDKRYWTMCKGGGHGGQETTGLVSVGTSYRCNRCRLEVDGAGDLREVVTATYGGEMDARELWCAVCRDSSTYRCNGLRRIVSERLSSVPMEGVGIVTRVWADVYGFYSSVSRRWYHAGMVEAVPVGDARWTRAEADQFAFRCEIYNALYPVWEARSDVPEGVWEGVTDGQVRVWRERLARRAAAERQAALEGQQT